MSHCSPTFCDLTNQVANVQRTWLECQAYLDWLRAIFLLVEWTPSDPAPLKANRMGAFSIDHRVLQMLLALGIPVWFVRRSNQIPTTVDIKTIVPAMYKTFIETGRGPFPTQAVYNGPCGYRRSLRRY